MNEIAGETTKELKVTSDLLSKYIKVVVTDTEGNAFEKVTEAGVAAVEGTLEAKQTGANTIIATAGQDLSAADKIVLKKGSTEQTITSAIGEDNRTITITTSTKISADSYTVEVTPADTGLAKLTATVNGEAETLAGLNFGKELALVSATNFYSVQTSITGANQWGEDYNLGSGTVEVYPSVAYVKSDSSATDKANAWDGSSVTNYDAKTKLYTLIKAGTIPFQVGDKVNFTAIYTSGATVVQSTAELSVANVPYVAEMTFGEPSTTNTKLQGKRITVSNFRKGTYYVPVVAKDQYGNTLKAETLNTKYDAQSLFVNPDSTQGAYGGFDATEKFSELDDGTVVMNVGAKIDSLPGDCVITIAGLGGLSTSTTVTVEDDPYIASMNVTIPGSLYQSTEATFEVEATDQYGDAVVLYDQDKLTKASTKKITLGDYNNLTKGVSSIEVSSGSLAFERNSAKKAVVFKYTPGETAVTDVMTITTASPKVETKTLTIGKVGHAASIQKTLDTTKDDSALTITSGKDVDFGNALVFVDTNGEIITGTNAAIQKPYFTAKEIKISAASGGLDTVAASATISAGNEGKQIKEGTTGYFYTITSGTTPTYSSVSKITSITESKTYTVNLYEVTALDAAGDGVKTAKLLDSKDFKVVVTNPNTEGNAYEEYEATIKAGDELLFSAHDDATGTDFDASILDSAEIIVKGTDANGNVATLTYNDDYTLTVDKGLDSTSVAGKISATDGVKVSTSASDLDEGEASVVVWDKKSGNQVATVKLPYSNAAPKASAWSVTKNTVDSANDGNVVPTAGTGNVKSAFEGDTIDVENAAGYAADTTLGVVKVANNSNGASYVLECKNQYGTRFVGAVWNIGGVATATSTGEKLTNYGTTGKTYTFQGTASGLDSFTFKAVVKADAAVAAAKAGIDTLNKTNVQVAALTYDAAKTVGDAVVDIEAGVLENIQKVNGLSGVSSTDLTITCKVGGSDVTSSTTTALKGTEETAITYTVEINYLGIKQEITGCSTNAKDNAD